MSKHLSRAIRIAMFGGTLLASPAFAATDAEKLARFETAKKLASEHIAKFDTLDFDVYTNQKWDRFAESHARIFSCTTPTGTRHAGSKTTLPS